MPSGVFADTTRTWHCVMRVWLMAELTTRTDVCVTRVTGFALLTMRVVACVMRDVVMA